jgi:replication factor A1
MVSFAYLVRIAKKYEIEVTKLFECIQIAKTKGEAVFDDLSIKRRQMTLEDGIFLITQNGNVVAQVKLTTKLLNYLARTDLRDIRFDDYVVTKQNTSESENVEIKDLNSVTKHFNLNVKVTEKSTPRIVPSMYGKRLLSTATISDRSGTIKLPLWNDQIDMASVGDSLHITNARLKRFRGELQVRIGKSTKVCRIEKKEN